jgi:hypothetical protein
MIIKQKFMPINQKVMPINQKVIKGALSSEQGTTITRDGLLSHLPHWRLSAPSITFCFNVITLLTCSIDTTRCGTSDLTRR